MAKAKKEGVAHSVLFQIGIFLMFVILIKGLDAGSIVEKSGGLLTGAAVYGQEMQTGVLEVRGDVRAFVNLLESKGFDVSTQTMEGITTLLFSGDIQPTSDALLECAKIAEKSGQLVQFYLKGES